MLLLGVVVLSPWPFGCVEAHYEYDLSLAVFALAALWAVHAVLTGRFHFRPDAGSLALAGLIAWTGFQLVPLPEGLLGVVSPGRAAWHRELQPAVAEVLPGEADGVPRPGAVPLSVNPAATRALLAQLLGLLVVYAAARNWLADRESLPRLLWALVGVGVLLGVFAVWQVAFTPAGTAYGSVPVMGNPFGPFVNRNHYPDYIALCGGGGLGLLLLRPEGGEWLTGRRVGLLAATAFVLLTVPPSLSRGGTLAVAAAGVGTWVLSRVGRDDLAGGWGRLALAGAVGLALVAAVTLGLSSVEARLGTLADSETAETEGRLPTWRNVLRLVPRFPLAGTGGGTFVVVEPTVRADPSIAGSVYDYAHNEYLEALVEGGAGRLVLTGLLVGGVLMAVGRGAVLRRDRSVGGPLLGLWFGLAVVALHAVTEFAVHTPAVAAAAAAVAGYAVAAAADGGFVPQRVKVRRKTGRGGRGRLTELPAVPAPAAVAVDTPPPADPHPERRWTARGPAAWAVGLLVAAAAGLVAADSRTRARVEAYGQAADAVNRGLLPAADPTAQRIVYAEARVRVRPDDPAGRLSAAEAHLQAAYERTVTENAALLGGAGGWAARVDRLADGPDLWAAVDHLRAARRASPAAGRVHARLGLLADHFRGEPARVHFDRAKRLLPADPEVWYAAGREAFSRGDRAAALADWKHGLTLGVGRLADILVQVRGLSVDGLRADLLPAEPAVSLAAADALYPDRLRQADARRPFLVAAVTQAQAKPAATGDDWMAAAKAADELGRGEQALDCWQAAVNNAPRSARVRDGFARWLEDDERYEQAIEQLRQLQRLTGSATVQDRIEACYHGLKLRQAIGG